MDHPLQIVNAGHRAIDQIMAAATALAAERDQWEQAAASHMRHIRELAKERDAAQDRADEAEARIERLQRAFIAAESCCEQCAAYQDQTRALWLQRWGLEDGDLPNEGSN